MKLRKNVLTAMKNLNLGFKEERIIYAGGKKTKKGIPNRCLPSFMERVYIFIFQNVGYQSV